MDSISHVFDILNILDDFSKSCFRFSEYIGFFRQIKSVPLTVENSLRQDDFIYNLTQASHYIQWLTDFFDASINPSLKKGYKKLSKSKPRESMTPYADFSVDPKPPVFTRKQPEQLNFEDILSDAEKNGKPIRKIRRRRNARLISYKGICPYCSAPNDYLYLNDGKNQYMCKCCGHTFSSRTTLHDDTEMHCPYCGNKLELKHDRNGYAVYTCFSSECSFYKKNRKLVDEGKGEHLRTSSGQYKLHYSYREFKFDLESLKNAEKDIEPKVNLSRAHASAAAIGLALTYYVNYGLSSRKVSLILRQVHGITMSHQTVINYAQSVAAYIKPLVDGYPYRLGSIQSGDETYVKILGKNHYVFFFSDPESKIITAYIIYGSRTTKEACKAIYDALSHYETIPEDMTLITDANPIYNAAQLFFEVCGIKFDLNQVTGVKNIDEESKEFRPYKQVEERLNRTFKQNYYGTNGYASLDSANSYMVLYVAFFNFLRQHSALDYRTPVDDNLFDEDELMQNRWIQLIELSYQYHMEH